MADDCLYKPIFVSNFSATFSLMPHLPISHGLQEKSSHLLYWQSGHWAWIVLLPWTLVLILLRIVPVVFLLLSDYQNASYTDNTVCSSPATLQGFSCLLEFRHLRTTFLWWQVFAWCKNFIYNQHCSEPHIIQVSCKPIIAWHARLYDSLTYFITLMIWFVLVLAVCKCEKISFYAIMMVSQLWIRWKLDPMTSYFFCQINENKRLEG